LLILNCLQQLSLLQRQIVATVEPLVCDCITFCDVLYGIQKAAVKRILPLPSRVHGWIKRG